MKYIKIFENFNSNIVYHFTEMINLYYILEENKLKAYRYFYNDFPNLYKKEHISKRMKFISLTRNKFLNTPNNIKNMGLEDQELLLRMDLDLNKISQKYKVISVDYFDDIDFYKKLYINIIENINALIKNTAIEININD